MHTYGKWVVCQMKCFYEVSLAYRISNCVPGFVLRNILIRVYYLAFPLAFPPLFLDIWFCFQHCSALVKVGQQFGKSSNWTYYALGLAFWSALTPRRKYGGCYAKGGCTRREQLASPVQGKDSDPSGFQHSLYFLRGARISAKSSIAPSATMRRLPSWVLVYRAAWSCSSRLHLYSAAILHAGRRALHSTAYASYRTIDLQVHVHVSVTWHPH
jgi:hypothetical protein